MKHKFGQEYFVNFSAVASALSWTRIMVSALLIMIAGFMFSFAANASNDSGDLASWHDGKVKQTIIKFVADVTNESSPSYVPQSGRIAVFDNDGTLWCEKPMYTQIFFAVYRAKELIKTDPEFANLPPVQAAVNGDFARLGKLGAKGATELISETHSGMSSDDFAEIVKSWISKAKHPRFAHLYTECVYQPMLEVLAYLRKNGFKTFIVSGGGIDFMRPWTERVYGVPPEQVVGSSCKIKYEVLDDKPEIMRLPEIDFIDDGEQKPVGIQKFIGRRPIITFGNSDGDRQMLEWTAAGDGKRLALLVHHTDAEREYAYDKDSSVGHLDKALTEAESRGWTVIDMKKDWKKIFPFDD